MVNYHSSVYIKWQLKILYNFNSEKDFRLIIVDNSQDEKEFTELEKLCKDYSNIDLINYTPKSQTASGQHGEGIDEIIKIANSKYIILQDPDFFWLKKDYLKWLEHLMKYNDAVGIPYPKIVSEGHSTFPGAFGCAFILERIKHISFKAYIDNDVELSWKKYHEFNAKHGEVYDFFYDVGWKVRKKLSHNNDYNFLSFHQKLILNAIGEKLNHKLKHSFETVSRIYYHNNIPVSLHLFRGTFTGRVKNHKDQKQCLNEELYEVRNEISAFIYDSISKNDFSFSEIEPISLSNLKITILFKIIFIKLLLNLKRTPIIKIILPIKKKSLLKILENICYKSKIIE